MNGLPQIARLLTLVGFRQGMFIWIVLAALPILVSMVRPDFNRLAVIGFELILLFMAWYLLTYIALPITRDLRQIQQGDYLIYWRYQADLWQKIVRQRAMGTFITILKLLIIFIGIILLLMLIRGPGANVDKPGDLNIELVCIGIFLFLIGIALLSDISIFAWGNKQGEIFISLHGIYQRPGGYIRLNGHYGASLQPRFEGNILKFSENIPTTSPRPASQKVIEINVPNGKEAEAQMIVDKFRQQLSNL